MMSTEAANSQTTDRLLRRCEVEGLVNLRRSAIYAKMRSGTFPEPIQIGGRTVRWWASEVESWLASRPRSHGEVGRRAAS